MNRIFFFSLILLSAVISCSSTSALIDAARSGNHKSVAKLATDEKYASQRSAALKIAIQNNDVKSANSLLEASPFDLQPALAAAALNGNLDFIQLLIENGAKPTTNVLNESAKSGCISCVKYFIKAGAKPEGSTLMASIIADSIEITKLLLDSGASPNTQESGTYLVLTEYSNGYKMEEKFDPRGKTALCIAIAKNLPEMVDLLLEHGADTETNFLYRDPPRLKAAEPMKSLTPGLSISNTVRRYDDGSSYKTEIDSYGNWKTTVTGSTPPKSIKAYASNQRTRALILVIRISSMEEETRIKIVKSLLNAGAKKDALDEGGISATDWARNSNSNSLKKLFGI